MHGSAVTSTNNRTKEAGWKQTTVDDKKKEDIIHKEEEEEEEDKTNEQAEKKTDKERKKERKKTKMTLLSKSLLKGMATALSIDEWDAKPESKCNYDDIDPNLSVNFICMQPSKPKPAADEDHSASATNQGDNPTTPISIKINKAIAARHQEIFVDLIGMHSASLESASPRHFLDDRFDSFLSAGNGEREFKDSLMEFLSRQTTAARQTHAYQYLEQILRDQMGFRNTYFWSNRKHYKRQEGQEQEQQNQSTTPTPMEEDTTVLPPRLMMKKRENPGHVFVCNSSVCDIQCDAFLCPGSISNPKKGRLSGSIVKQWKNGTLETNTILQNHLKAKDPFKFKTYGDDHDRVVTLMDWPWQQLASANSQIPFVVFGEVSLEKSQRYASMSNKARRSQSNLPPQEKHIEALMVTVQQFLHVAIQELEEHQSQGAHCYRERYLLALPILGTGGGFAGDLMGRIIHELLEILTKFVTTINDDLPPVDIVLVCADDATYTHAQMIRRKQQQKQCGQDYYYYPCFDQLDSQQQLRAKQLAQLAADRHLALFVGAGVSIGSGLPSWFGLLHLIEDQFTPTGNPQERTLGNDTNWDPLKMADILQDWCLSRQDRFGIQQSLKQRVCNYLRDNGTHIGLLLTLLISLPCRAMVTQNYDQLIEKACQRWNVSATTAATKNNNDDSSTNHHQKKKQLSVIPYNPKRNSKYWLLKMHGCIMAPHEIILTSQDYKEYDSTSSRSKALAGLVQASLMTQHLLFVGFSLSDPNYLRIVDEVRDALKPYHHIPPTIEQRRQSLDELRRHHAAEASSGGCGEDEAEVL